MGLDPVELVMEVEDKFDIVIWEAEFPGLVTVGDLHALIVDRLLKVIAPPPEPSVCPSIASFLKVRQFLIANFGINRSSIRPQTRLEDLLPITDREQHWGNLCAKAELRLPGLTRSRFEVTVGFVLPFAACALPTLIALGKDEPGVAVLTGGAGIIAFLILASFIAPKFPPSLLPTGIEVVADLVKFSLGKKMPSESVIARYSTTAHDVDRDAIWRDLVQQVCDQLGVKESNVMPSSRFIEDLRCG